MFARVLVALDSRSGRRDALVFGAQLAGAGGAVVVADLLPTAPTSLAGGTAASAQRRESLRDAGEEVYATLGPDPRVRYLPVSGLPLADAIVAIARRERAGVIVVPQSVAGHEAEARRLFARAPCPVAVAPYGHRFARAFAPRRIAVASGGARADELAAAAQRLLPAGESLLAGDPRSDADLLVIGDFDAEVLRSAACPVLVVGEAVAGSAVAAPGRR